MFWAFQTNNVNQIKTVFQQQNITKTCCAFQKLQTQFQAILSLIRLAIESRHIIFTGERWQRSNQHES